ncbi:hypothetical protein ZHAS_00016851 [Anopheles sinensis]|uniref:Uncharacterized protein n=1 Tax=Anopheles sinensis TaxID=74873 RepID=A0A084WE97_ANOSI|nr:hypothetical protein ZHAS_00016851 [Anopheles sinensis]
MFIFLLFASDGCRNVCQVFSQRLGAQLRRHRRTRAESHKDADRRKDRHHDSHTHRTHTPYGAASHWRASLRTWIKCLCAGGSCAFTPPTTPNTTSTTTTTTSTDGGRVCVEGGEPAGSRIRTVVKLLLQKLLHQA